MATKARELYLPCKVRQLGELWGWASLRREKKDENRHTQIYNRPLRGRVWTTSQVGEVSPGVCLLCQNGFFGSKRMAFSSTARSPVEACHFRRSGMKSIFQRWPFVPMTV